MTSIDCLTKICESPDVTCPSCNRNMSLWVWKENIIFRCDECNALGFKVNEEQMKKMAEGSGAYGGRAAYNCSECGKLMGLSILDEWVVARCEECGNIFTVYDESREAPEMDDASGSRFSSILNWIGGVYDKMTTLQ